jgi:hypothetical protein
LPLPYEICCAFCGNGSELTKMFFFWSGLCFSAFR